MRPLAPALGLLVAGTAHAACPNPDLDEAGLEAELVSAAAALDESNLASAARTLNQLANNLPCLDAVVDRGQYARFARLMGTVAFYGQEEALATRWGLSARLADPDLDWTVPADHPYRELVDESEDPPMGRATGSMLAPPPGGGVFVDGELILEPTAYGELTHLVQVLDRNAQVVDGYWQDGAVFAERILVAGDGPVEAPGWWVDGEVVGGNAKVAKGPSGPKEPRAPREGGGDFPVVPVAVSGGLAATSLVTYVLAGSAQGSLADQTSTEGLTQARTTANTLTLISGLTFAGAVGVGFGGVLLSPGGVVVHARF